MRGILLPIVFLLILLFSLIIGYFALKPETTATTLAYLVSALTGFFTLVLGWVQYALRT